jgi:CHAD domain-containing protein
MQRWLGTALRRGWQRCRNQLKRSRRKPSRGHIHQFRVEGRRLLAVLTLVAPFVSPGPLKKVRQQLKRHLDVFAPLRDVQVQRDYVRTLRDEFPGAARFYRWLTHRESRLRTKTHRAIRTIRLRKWDRKIEAVQNELERKPTRKLRRAAPLIAKTPIQQAFAELVRRQRRLKPNRPETIHSLRVAFKRFRYLLGSLAPAFPLLDPQSLRAMAAYQRQMGAIQDLAVLDAALMKFARRQRSRKSHTRELKQLRRALRGRSQQKTKAFLVSATRYKTFWPVISPTRTSN